MGTPDAIDSSRASATTPEPIKVVVARRFRNGFGSSLLGMIAHHLIILNLLSGGDPAIRVWFWVLLIAPFVFGFLFFPERSR